MGNDHKLQKIILNKDYHGVVDQIIRPTGLLDPIIDVRPSLISNKSELIKSLTDNKYGDMDIFSRTFVIQNQIDDLLDEVNKSIKNGQRSLIITLTKRMAEELTTFLKETGIAVSYIHSDVDTIERIEILRDLRLGKYDVLVGINLLREGLDLPEVSLVAILDADKEGFLRSGRALIQIAGRAARHVSGRVIMYADHVTRSMKEAIDETNRRRRIQKAYNRDHGIIPQSIHKAINEHIVRVKDKFDKDKNKVVLSLEKQSQTYNIMRAKEKKSFKKELELQMDIYADMLEFEKAARLRDILNDLS